MTHDPVCRRSLPSPLPMSRPGVDGLAQVMLQQIHCAGSPLPCIGLGNPRPIWRRQRRATCGDGLRQLRRLARGNEPALAARLGSGLALNFYASEPAAPEAALTPEHREAAVELLRLGGRLSWLPRSSGPAGAKCRFTWIWLRF